MKEHDHNQILKIANATLLGTTAMTAFSYLSSNYMHKQFREPEVLNTFISHSGFSVGKSALPGWTLHYLTGILFAVAYDKLWKNTSIKPTTGQAALLGALSAVVGVTIWKLVFTLHPNPPAIDRKNYFLQLIPAHILFGIFSAMGYRMIGNRKLI